VHVNPGIAHRGPDRRSASQGSNHSGSNRPRRAESRWTNSAAGHATTIAFIAGTRNRWQHRACLNTTRRGAMSTTAKQIMAKEQKFWTAMREQDVQGAIELLDDTAIVAGMQGIHHFDHAGYREMAEQGPMKLNAFSLSDERVVFPTADVAVATYTVEQNFSVDGKAMDMVSYDTSTWVRKNGEWRCVAHTESPRKGPDDKPN
jgi:ketosteroid isomerase-like protein